MKYLKHGLILAIGIAGNADLLHANQMSFGSPTFSGTGCTADSTIVDYGDGVITIGFKKYTARVGGNILERVGSSDCNISLPLFIPRGYSAVIESVEYSGFAILPEQGQLSFYSDFYLSNNRGSSMTYDVEGPFFDTFFTRKNYIGETNIHTNCQKTSLLRINSDLTIATNENYDEAEASIGKLDVTGKAKYYYRLRPCF